MAEVTHVYKEQLTEQTSTSSAWVSASCAIIGGTDITWKASTKYLIVAKGVLSSNDAAAVVGMRVHQPLSIFDDWDGDTASSQFAELMYTTSGEGLGYFFCRSYTTLPSPYATAQLQIQIQSNGTDTVRADQMSLLLIELDDMGERDTGYFDGSWTDSTGSWTNEDNALDGSTSTAAYTDFGGVGRLLKITGGNTLTATGTNPDCVRIRVYYSVTNYVTGNTSLTVRLRNDADTATIDSLSMIDGQPNANITSRWSPWRTASTSDSEANPWTKSWLENCNIDIYSGSLADGNYRTNVYKIEIEAFDGYLEAEGRNTISKKPDTTWNNAAEDTSYRYPRLESTSLAASTEYLVLGYQNIWISSATRSIGVRLMGDSDAGDVLDVLALHEVEGEDSNEIRLVGLMGRVLTDAAPAVGIQIEAQQEVTAANANPGHGYLVAFDVSKFADFDYSFAATGVTVSGTPASPTTLETISAYNPTTSGNHLVLGRYNYTVAGADSRVSGQLTVGGTSVLSGDTDTFQTQAWDPTDGESVVLMGRESISSSGDIDLDGATHASDTDATSQYEFVCVLNLNLAAGAPPFRRRQLTTVRM